MGNKEYLKERREWLHEHHFCVDCKKQDAHTLIGRYRCYDCTEKIRLKRFGHKYKREERKELGLCSMCMNPLKEGFNVCEQCYERILKDANHNPTPQVVAPKMSRKERVENGYCINCGEKAMEGYKVCESCRQHLIDISLSRKKLGQDSYWRNSMHSLFF